MHRVKDNLPISGPRSADALLMTVARYWPVGRRPPEIANSVVTQGAMTTVVFDERQVESLRESVRSRRTQIDFRYRLAQILRGGLSPIEAMVGIFRLAEIFHEAGGSDEEARALVRRCLAGGTPEEIRAAFVFAERTLCRAVVRDILDVLPTLPEGFRGEARRVMNEIRRKAPIDPLRIPEEWVAVLDARETFLRRLDHWLAVAPGQYVAIRSREATEPVPGVEEADRLAQKRGWMPEEYCLFRIEEPPGIVDLCRPLPESACPRRSDEPCRTCVKDAT